MDNLQSSAENLQNEISRLEKLMGVFSQFPKQLAKLQENAKHDPVERARLEKLHQALNSNSELSKNLQKIQELAIEIAKVHNNTTAFVPHSGLDPMVESAATIKLPQADKAHLENKAAQAPKKKLKLRSFI